MDNLHLWKQEPLSIWWESSMGTYFYHLSSTKTLGWLVTSSSKTPKEPHTKTKEEALRKSTEQRCPIPGSCVSSLFSKVLGDRGSVSHFFFFFILYCMHTAWDLDTTQSILLAWCIVLLFAIAPKRHASSPNAMPQAYSWEFSSIVLRQTPCGSSRTFSLAFPGSPKPSWSPYKEPAVVVEGVQLRLKGEAALQVHFHRTQEGT